MSNHEWRLNKHKLDIARGQQWRKKDSGNLGTILAISSDHVVMQQPRKKRAQEYLSRLETEAKAQIKSWIETSNAMERALNIHNLFFTNIAAEI